MKRRKGEGRIDRCVDRVVTVSYGYDMLPSLPPSVDVTSCLPPLSPYVSFPPSCLALALKDRPYNVPSLHHVRPLTNNRSLKTCIRITLGAFSTPMWWRSWRSTCIFCRCTRPK